MPSGAPVVAESLVKHRPVMVEAALEALGPREGALLLDGTVGQAGHARAWLEAAPRTRVVGLDLDRKALSVAERRLAEYGTRAQLHHADYRDAASLWPDLGLPPPDAVLLDLGLGSHQLEDPERGFSFQADGPLDMRFDPSTPGPTAAELVRQTPEPELERILADYGEERHARKLARALVRAREHRPLSTTHELAELVRRTLARPGKPPRIDPATRTFQALRIAVNQELDGLAEALEELVRLLPPEGRLVVIAFHSAEDRMVKQTLKRLATEIVPQPGDPPEVAREAVLARISKKVVKPTDREIAANPRSRSARLRWGVRA
jgi:16S rRNA (cytosine1402-N4)-methyltransferase